MRIKDGFKGERSIVLPQAIVNLMKKDPLASYIYITDIGYYPKAMHHFRQRKSAITEYILIYCMDGSGWFKINNKKYEVKSHQYFIIPPGEPHTYASDDSNPWSIYWIHFGGIIAKYYVPDCIKPHDISPSIVSRIHTRLNLFEDIFNTLNASYAIENLRYAMATLQHFLASLRYMQQYHNASQHKERDDIANLVIHFFEENIEKKLSLSSIAKFTGISASRLSAIFKDSTGYSPIHYFNLLKIKKACELIDTTPMKLNQISLKLGFEDPLYFSRLFSKTMGKSPKAYRNS